MTISERNRRFEHTTDAEVAQQPRIWVEGQQRPRFDIPAYMAVSVAIARRDLGPEMDDAAGRLQRFGQRVSHGEIKAHMAWAGRAAHVVPSHRRVGRWLLALSALFSDTRDLLAPPVLPDAELAYPNLVRGSLPLHEADAPKPAAEPTLHAIRSAISDTPHGFANETPGRKGPAQAPYPDDAVAVDMGPVGISAGLKRVLWRAACWALLGVVMAFAMPGGAIKALMFYLDGGDLRDWS
jgi:hypothetical protein